MEPKRPTVRPGRPVPPVDKESDPPSSDDREKLLREIRDVEVRGKLALERATSEVSRVYEQALTQRDETIRSLQNQLLQATSADGTINVSLAHFRQELAQLRADMVAISLRVNKEQAPEQIEAATTAAGAKTRGVQLKAILGSILAAIVSSGILIQLAQSCSEPTRVEVPDTRPRPAGTGFAGRP